MPFETVNEQVYRQQKVKVCERCRHQISEGVQNRGTYNAVGSVAGSLGTSMGGSMLGGAVLGPVGAIGGAIGGAILGSKAGAAASDTACDAIENVKGHLCEECKAGGSHRPSGQMNWGGGRLGDASTGSASGLQSSLPQQEQTAGERISAAASTAGQRIGEGWSRLSQSVSSALGGGGGSEGTQAGGASSGRAKAGFVPFAGSGYKLSSEAQPTKPSNPSRLLDGPAAVGAPQAAAQASQIEEDEALARRLQEEFLREDQERRQQ